MLYLWHSDKTANLKHSVKTFNYSDATHSQVSIYLSAVSGLFLFMPNQTSTFPIVKWYDIGCLTEELLATF